MTNNFVRLDVDIYNKCYIHHHRDEQIWQLFDTDSKLVHCYVLRLMGENLQLSKKEVVINRQTNS